MDNIQNECIVTADMEKEEDRVHQEAQYEYQKKLKEMRCIQFNQEEKEKRAKRLQFLVDRASIYSNWLAEKLEARQKEQAEAQENSTTIVDDDGAKQESNAPSEPNASNATQKSVPPKRKTKSNQSKRKKSKTSFGLQTASGISSDKNLPKRTGRQPVLVTGGNLREYQLVGMEWLISLYDNGLNGILADEMGLGKTLQAIAFLAHLREMGTLGPFLIVAPLTTLSNWVSEIERFTPDIPVVLYHGTPTERMYIRNHKLRFDDDSFPIVVTSYEICMNDRKYLQQIMWRFIIVDEGHRIKNMNCRLIRELKSYQSANRLLLTGTPLQNNLSELWSLLNFLMPDIFDDVSAFEEWFDFTNDLSQGNNTSESSGILNPQEQSNLVNNLHQILKPFLLRRQKTDVLLDLPKKREYILYAPLVAKQVELYEATLKGELRQVITRNIEKNFESNELYVSHEQDVEQDVVEDVVEDLEQDLENVETLKTKTTRSSKRGKTTLDYKEKSDRSYFKSLENQSNTESIPKEFVEQDSFAVKRVVNAQKLSSMIVQLRKVCNHPYLFDISQQDELEFQDSPQLPEIVSWSGKMLILDRLLTALFANGHKVLIFSQMTRMLDIICDWCEFVKRWPFCRIDGQIKIDDRRQEINRFNTDPNVKLFLLSTRAGGLGINLTSADTVIIFDSDWNPQADLQAQDRAHRIGQTKPVIIYRLVTAGSVEAKVIEKANAKRKLEKLVIHKGHFKGNKKYYESNTVTDLSDLELIMSKDDTLKVNASCLSNSHQQVLLSDEDLKRLLDRSPEAYESNHENENNDKFKMIEAVQDDMLAGL